MAVQRLQRSLKPIHVFAFTYGSIIGWGAFMLSGDQFLPHAGPLGTAIAMLIAAFVAIVIACNYGFMVHHHWGDGGEFAYANMAFGRRHAFICSWFTVLGMAGIVPLNTTAISIIVRNLFGSLFQWKYLYSVAGFEIYLGEVLLAAAVVLLLAQLSNSGVKRAGNFITALVILELICVAIVVVAAFIGPKNRMLSSPPAFSPDVNPLMGIMAILAVSPWAFAGFNAPSHAVEEIGFEKKNIMKIVVISIILGALMYTIITVLSASTYPLKYHSWPEYLRNIRSHSGWQSMPSFYAASQALGQWGVILLGIASVSAIMGVMVGFFMIGSRLLYAMARSHVIPKAFGRLHSKYRTPNFAVLFIMFLGLVVPFFGRNALLYMVPLCSLGAAVGYGYTSAAAMKFALKEKNTKIVCTGAFGILMSVVAVVLLFIPVESLSSTFKWPGYILLAIWIVLGAILRLVALKNERKKIAIREKSRQERLASSEKKS